MKYSPNDPDRYVRWRPITCPKCRSRSVKVTTTCPMDAIGAQNRYVACRECYWRFVAVTPPDDDHDDEGFETDAHVEKLFRETEQDSTV